MLSKESQGHPVKINSDTFFEGLIDSYYKKLMNLAYTYVKDWSTAEDIVQDVFIKVFHKMEQFEERSSIKTWLYRITMNQCKDYLRKSYIKRVVITGIMDKLSPVDDETPERSFEKVSMDKDLAECILQLPLKYREAIILYYYEDLSIPEMSDLLKEKEATMKSRIQRARKRLKDILLKRGISYE
ncbi:MAG: sigma-70 family RNA polymerase sigma factor [Bacillaceae bacterium]|nr:sigma-70 family RNA polymerase sigma factor [Bacillaceae bacterium]